MANIQNVNQLRIIQDDDLENDNAAALAAQINIEGKQLSQFYNQFRFACVINEKFVKKMNTWIWLTKEAVNKSN